MGPFLAKIDNFGLDPHIFDAKTDPFIRFGTNLFVYLKNIGIQTIEKITGKILCCVSLFGQNTGLKKPVCEPSPLVFSGVLRGAGGRHV